MSFAFPFMPPVTSLTAMLRTVPLVQLKTTSPQNTIFALLEKYNLCGSIKAKTVYRMLKTDREKGILDPSKVILEASSGNTAIALAYFGCLRGIAVEIVLPTTTASCKKRLIVSYGAKLHEVAGITDDCIVVRDQFVRNNPGMYYVPDQFTNYANMDAHYHLTGPWIYEQCPQLDFFCAGLGTSGTLLGVAKYLKERNPAIKIIGINPIEKVEGLRNFKVSQVHIPFYQEYDSLIDEIVDVTEAAIGLGVQSYLDEGYFVGLSSGAILTGLQHWLQEKTKLTGVVIAPDGGDYYLEKMGKYADLEKYVGCR